MALFWKQWLDSRLCGLGKSGDMEATLILSVQSPKQLDVAPKGASAELEGLTGVWAAVKCLVAVGSSNVDLIKAHARSAGTLSCCSAIRSSVCQVTNAMQFSACATGSFTP